MKYLFTLSLAAVLFVVGCDSDSGLSGDDDDIPVPTAYSFESRFEEGESSVFYGGQVVRNLLVNDLKTMIDRLGTSGATAVTEEDLLRRYDYEDSYDLETLTTTGSFPPATASYTEIDTGKDLVGKIDGARLISVDQTADAVIRDYIAQIAANSQDPAKLGTPAVYTDENGVDMSQMIHKILLGAVTYSQATGTYLDTILDQNNDDPEGAAAYSQMEHNWDEAFGYFGAARDFSQYGDSELAEGLLWKDSDGDGEIDLSSEYNFTFAGYAAKRDVGASGVDYTGTLFNAFLEGRTAIANESSANAIAEPRDLIVRMWEQVVAANVIHYINGAIGDMDTVTEAQVADKNNEDLNEHWSEAKGFAFALQYNPFKLISNAGLAQLHELLGDAPAYALPGSDESDRAIDDLLAARDLLQAVYAFSDENTQNW